MDKNIHNIVMITGMHGAGKSTTAVELIRQYKSHNPISKVAAYDPLRRFDGLIDIKISKGKVDPWEKIWNIENSLCVFYNYTDLCPTYVDEEGEINYGVSPRMLEFFSHLRYKNNSVILITQSAKKINLLLSNFVTHYYLFCSEPGDTFTKAVYGYKKLNKELSKVNEYCQKIGGFGRHKNDPDYNGQGFPRIIVDIPKKSIIKCQMKATVK